MSCGLKSLGNLCSFMMKGTTCVCTGNKFVNPSLNKLLFNVLCKYICSSTGLDKFCKSVEMINGWDNQYGNNLATWKK